MNFDQGIFEATQRVLDMDGLPDDLLPLVILSEVAPLRRLDSESRGTTVWY